MKKGRSFLAAVAALVACVVAADARFPRGGSSGVDGYGTLKIGGGGYTTGIQICADGTMTSRTNTAGGYVATVSNPVWRNTTTSATLPSAVYSSNSGTTGVAEIQAACVDTQYLYAMHDGYIIRSTDQGYSWTNTAWTRNTNQNPNAGPSGSGSNGTYGPLIAVDPQARLIMMAGSPGDKMYYTINGGTSFVGISTAVIPTVAADAFYSVAYRPNSSVSGGQSQEIWVCPYGSQCYFTTTGPAGTWTATTSGPTSAFFLRVDTAGTVWVSDQAADLWRYNGSWTKVLPAASGDFWGTSISDPSDLNKVWAISYGGKIKYSSTGGGLASWSATSTMAVTATDAPWLQTAAHFQISTTSAAWDTSTGKVYSGAGTGVFRATLPTSAGLVTWDSASVTQESLVATTVLSCVGGTANMFSWDRAAFQTSDPKTYRPVQNGYVGLVVDIMGGWGGDCAGGSTALLLATDNLGGAGSSSFYDLSGISTDNGVTWTPFGVAVTTASIATGVGSKTICPAGVGTNCAGLQGLNITIGDRIQVYQQGAYGSFYNGLVTAYNTSTGELIINADNTDKMAGAFTTVLVHTVPAEVITGKFGGCIAAYSTTHFVWVPSRNASRPYYTTDGGKNWLPITIGGIPTTGTTGWGNPPNGGGYAGCQVTADKSAASATFKLVNTSVAQPGIYTCTTSAGLSCTRTRTSVPTVSDNPRIRAVPGKTNELFYSGRTSSDAFSKSTDGGATWSAVLSGASAIENVQAFCFGATFVGQSYPSMYISGAIGGTFGFYQSHDGGTTWALKDSQQWPNKNFDLVVDCAGDPVTPGYVYIGFQGSGFAYYGRL